MFKSIFPIFFLWFFVWPSNLFGQNNEWVEKEFEFVTFYTIMGGFINDGGEEMNFLDNYTDELREPIKINSLYQNNEVIEIIIEFNCRGGQNVKIHFFFHGNLNRQYIVETKANRGSVVNFENCKGNFEVYTSSENENNFEFILYNEIARTHDNVYIFFSIERALLF
jgi:hypothetical protein